MQLSVPIGLAPFGIGEDELPVSLDEVAERIRPHHPVVAWTLPESPG